MKQKKRTHECIIDLLNLAQDKDLDKVAFLIMRIDVDDKHDEIIALWNARTKDLEFDSSEVLNRLESQKSENAKPKLKKQFKYFKPKQQGDGKLQQIST
ncbi:hypothetical protein CVU83_02915 [Candidatus Falkowbacteria bacterium HGW-Falkowbacteria-2]|uniref:Uncharacterized protein n=1 Tax=Candidatus Falkowbacteria bacterium HGW-Falkowbacteria-2 TaxID=2013769 RepID=A0A2N2DYJ3_9BACT|nr:MAG: hypothetical protein CVU83_02915 [Candidatus Falkowbacteria bacterium HGW-Falkowbacteria-2]